MHLFGKPPSTAMPDVDRMLEEWPPAPPNTEDVASVTSPRDSVWSFHSSLLDDDTSDAPLRAKAPFRAAHVLASIEEEKPGLFYESDTDVPNNTPYGTEDPSTPRSVPPALNNLSQLLSNIDIEPLPESYLPITNHLSTEYTFSEDIDGITGNDTTADDMMAETISAETTSSASDALYMADTKRQDKAKPRPEEREGLLEFSNWAPDVEADLKHALLRLANLAHDEHLAGPEHPVDFYYKRRLQRLINDKDVKYAYGNIGDVPVPDPAGTATKSSSPSRHSSYITRSEFLEFERRVGANEKRIGLAVDKSFANASHLVRFKSMSESKMEEQDAELKSLQGKARATASDLALLKSRVMTIRSEEAAVHGVEEGAASKKD